MFQIPTSPFMEADPRSQEVSKWDALAMTLRKEFETLGLKLENAARGGPPVCVGLWFIFTQSLHLEALRVQLEHKYAPAWHLEYIVDSPAYEMIRCGNEFQKLKYILDEQQNSIWDITVASIDRRHMRVHARFCEEDDRLRDREKHAIEGHLEWIALFLDRSFLGKTDFALTLRDHRAMKSHCVLGLFQTLTGYLRDKEAVAGIDGTIYVRGDVNSVWGTQAMDLPPPAAIYIKYHHSFLELTRTRTSFPESAGEPETVGIRDTEGGRRRESLQNAPPELGASAYANLPAPVGVVAHNEAGSVLGSFQDSSTNTFFETSYPQSGITDYYARMAMGPSGVLPAPERAIDVYGFTHITPSAPMNDVFQRLLPYESRDRAAPVSMTSPEADSPWSERDGPPPPYALSPGTYHLRLEAATRPSPPSR